MVKKQIQEESIQKPPPIMVVPDKSYIDETDDTIPVTDVIVIADLEMYQRMLAVLEAWGNEPLGIPGQRGDIKE